MAVLFARDIADLLLGTYDAGVTDIKALAVRLKSAQLVHRDETTGAETTHYTLEIDRPSNSLSFAEAEKISAGKGAAFFKHLDHETFILAVESGRHTDAETGTTF